MKRVIALCAAAALCLTLLSACGSGKNEEKQVDLAAFAQTVTENHEFSGFLERVDVSDPDMGEFMADMMNNYYPGLTDLDLEQMEVYMSMISFSGGELALAKAKSAEDAEKVKGIFQARVDAKTTEGPGNYPGEVEMWTNSSQVAANGTYVMLVCADDCADIVSEFNALFD